jgi:hypothetical protein
MEGLKVGLRARGGVRAYGVDRPPIIIKSPLNKCITGKVLRKGMQNITSWKCERDEQTPIRKGFLEKEWWGE